MVLVLIRRKTKVNEDQGPGVPVPIRLTPML